jgi:thiol-disulfide isomerase/thioredoxin
VKIFKLYLFLVCLSINHTIFAQKPIEIIKFQDLENLIQKDDRIYVFNFWASWCKPCVTEMPAFETLANNFHLKKVSVIFISLDFKRDLKIVEKFVTDNQIKSKVYFIDEPDYNSWINKISPHWSGSIPATLISNGTRKEFYEQSFDYQSLSNIIRHFF